MKKLVFSHVATWPSHHAESVEIALTEHSNGHEVFFLSCVGSLKTCPANAANSKVLCKVCRLQTRHTESTVLPPEIHLIHLQIEDFDYTAPKFASTDELAAYEYKSVPVGSMVYSTLTSELEDSFFDTLQHKPRIEELLKNAIGLYETGKDLIVKEGIEHVYVWNGRRSCDGPLTYAARHQNIGFTTFISGGKYNSILTRENTHTVHDIDSAKAELNKIVHDIDQNRNRFEIIRDGVNFFDFASGGRSNKKMNYLGYYQFSQGFDKSLTPADLNKASPRKIISVFTGTYSEFAGVPGYDDAGGFCKNFYEGVSFLQENIHKIENAELWIRWHPNSRRLQGNEKKKLKSIIERGSRIEGVNHIPPESNFNTYDLINRCDVAVCFGTSVSVESCLYGKPAIFIGRNMFEGLDCFYKPKSYQELLDLLNSDLKPRNFDHALAWGYFFSSFGNKQYQHLVQKGRNLFYYKTTRLLSPLLAIKRYLGMARRAYRRFAR